MERKEAIRSAYRLTGGSNFYDGILTMPLYRTLPKADITCLDYSADMMGQAQEKADRLHLKNVTFRQGDVGALPYADGAFDIVLSLNGFHAFPDKEAAYREVFRVLKPGGTFCGCFYPICADERSVCLVGLALREDDLIHKEEDDPAGQRLFQIGIVFRFVHIPP